MRFLLKVFFCFLFVFTIFLSGYAYEQPVINQSGQVGIVRVYSAKSLGATRLSFNFQSDLAYDKKYLLQLIDKKDHFLSDADFFSSELDTLFPDPTIFNMRFNAAYGITSFLEVSFMLPVYFDLLSHKKNQSGLGDLELGIKFRIPGDEERLFQAAFLSMFSIPSGDPHKGYFPRNIYYFTEHSTGDSIEGNDELVGAYTSGKMETFLAVLFSFEWKYLLFHINSGVKFTHNKSLDELFVMGTALEYHPSKYVAIFTELSSFMRFSTVSNGFRINDDPFRITPGIKLNSSNGMTFSLAGSFRLSSNKNFSYYGLDNSGRHFVTGIEPSWQISAQIGWNGRLKPQDKDKDLVLDKFDACPEIPEDIDNFEDSDGCPDLDNDHDAIPDSLDQCPNEAEDLDGFEDDDGCPDLDNDQDGISDSVDQCPNEAEDLDGFNDFDGCPISITTTMVCLILWTSVRMSLKTGTVLRMMMAALIWIMIWMESLTAWTTVLIRLEWLLKTVVQKVSLRPKKSKEEESFSGGLILPGEALCYLLRRWRFWIGFMNHLWLIKRLSWKFRLIPTI